MFCTPAVRRFARGVRHNVAASIPIVGDARDIGGQFPTSATRSNHSLLPIFLIPAIAGSSPST